MMDDVLKCNVAGPFAALRCTLDAGHNGTHQHFEMGPGSSMSARWSPEPEKPREWTVAGTFEGYSHLVKPPILYVGQCIRVHDADACDRLHAPDHRCKLRTDEYHFEKVIESFRRWQGNRQGAAVQFAFVNPSGQLEIASEL